MAAHGESKELKSTGYELFILLLSLVSVFNMAFWWINELFDLSLATLGVLDIINALLTLFFFFDFSYRLVTASSKSGYFFMHSGWADLLACVPQLRMFRVFRILRAVRLMRTFGLKNMVNEVVNNRAASALYITMFSIIVIAEVVGSLILEVESGAPDGNIQTAGDAVWWIFVTMTTVGYGDHFPVTDAGRTLATFVMLSGVALIGVLASFLSNFFLAPPKEKAAEYRSTDPRAKLSELKSLLSDQQAAQAALAAKVAELERML